MWKQIFLVAILLLAMSSAYAENIDGVGDNYVQDTSSYPKITQIERKMYSKSYESEDIYKRLDRLEDSLYHKSFSSDDLATRVDNISDKANYSAMPGYLLDDISKLEKDNFSKIFKNDNSDARLERLEYHLIGAAQSGNYKDRVYKLKSLNDQYSVSDYLDNNSYAYDDDYSPPKQHSTTKMSPKITTRVQDILFMVAPFLFGLL